MDENHGAAGKACIKSFPNLRFPKPQGRGPQKTPVKVQTTIRLDRDVIEYFRRQGRGWQTRLNMTLRNAVSRKRGTRRARG